MLGGILVIIFGTVISFVHIDALKKSHPGIDTGLLKRMFLYHVVLSLCYFGYIMFNPSDSRAYYEKITLDFRGDTWGSFYGTSTTFIEFVGYPFVKYMGFSFEAMMALFSLFGFYGFLYFYIFFKENIKFKHTFAGYDLLTLTFFLPNLHFWSASLGKGSIIFLGLGLFFYSISKIPTRLVALALGSFIIYHVRPHVMLVVLVSSAIGFIFTTKGVSIALRVLFLVGASIAFFFIYKDVLTMVGIDEEQLVSQSFGLSNRAKELSKATSGIDISQYSLPLQVFTFLYRPLFFDAPGLLGIIVSFENVFYVMVSLTLIGSFRGIRFLVMGNFLAKSAFLSFITISIALAQISGNLGLAMRQKSQVMILLMYVILAFRDDESLKVWRREQIRKKFKREAQSLRMQPTTPKPSV
ncbi:hypothetical protein [Chryseolinea soli]|uniref:hypothetical protein n=1 Tax=Chryseolinea soli TaxID=2321403 RepID=UPI001359248F|nr:hypothetical protein [Chryseolinea soli]